MLLSIKTDGMHSLLLIRQSNGSEIKTETQYKRKWGLSKQNVSACTKTGSVRFIPKTSASQMEFVNL